MKITFFTICITLLVYACGNADNKASDANDPNTTANNTPAAADTPAAAAPADAGSERGLELIAQADCTTCHKIEEKLTGPAYRDVANKYTANEETINQLANKVIKGGSGNWGPVPMTPHPALAIEDAREMVKYVLSLKNK